MKDKHKKIKSRAMKINNKLKKDSKDSFGISSFNKINYEKNQVITENTTKKEEENYQNHIKKDKKFFEYYLAPSLDNLEYDDAIVKDKRTF